MSDKSKTIETMWTLPKLTERIEEITAFDLPAFDREGNPDPDLIAEIDSIDSASNDKIDGYIIKMQELETQAGLLKAEAKAKKARLDEHVVVLKADYELSAKAATNALEQIESMKHRIIANMQARGCTELEGVSHHLAIKSKGGKLPVIIDNEKFADFSKWDDRFIKVTHKADRDALLEAHANGDELPDNVTIGVRGSVLEIKGLKS